MTIAPVVVETRIAGPPERAFALFCGRIGAWWPKQMSVSAAPMTDVVLEPFAGGRWFQRDAAGEETPWGEVLAWEPPERLLLAWRLNGAFAYDPQFLTHVEVTFAPDGAGGCRVRLEHRDMHRFGADAERLAGQFGGGWARILQSYADLAGQEPVADS